MIIVQEINKYTDSTVYTKVKQKGLYFQRELFFFSPQYANNIEFCSCWNHTDMMTSSGTQKKNYTKIIIYKLYIIIININNNVWLSTYRDETLIS